MGNHTVGRAMGRMAEQLSLRRQPSETALELLDLICQPYADIDAEFEAEDPKRPGHTHPDYGQYIDPEAPLGTLMIEAFAPNGLADQPRYLKERKDSEDGDSESWGTEVELPFRQRYKFW